MKTEQLMKQLATLEGEPAEPGDGHLDPGLLRQLRAGSLSEEARAAVEGHLAACGQCTDVLLTLDSPEAQLSPGRLRTVLAATEPGRSRVRRPGWQLAAGGLALAAAVTMVVIFPRNAGPPLPAFELSLAGQVMEARSASPQAPVVAGVYYASSDLLLRAQCGSGAGGQTPVVGAYLQQPDGRWSRFEPSPEVQWEPESGLLEVKIRVGELLGDRLGRHAVALALAPVGEKLPTQVTSLEALGRASQQVLRAEVDYRQEPE